MSANTHKMVGLDSPKACVVNSLLLRAASFQGLWRRLSCHLVGFLLCWERGHAKLHLAA